MVRFQVIRGSRLLLAIAVALFVLVGTALVLNYALGTPDPAPVSNASLVESQADKAAQTRVVFAASSGDHALSGIREDANAPRILIYHTHTHEAYAQMDDDPYVAVEAWRTADRNHSVVRVGAELARQLRSYGFQVIHDTTDHEQDALSTAYTRSLSTLEGYDRSFDLYIDLHRDACVDDSGDIDDAARLMLLIGNGVGFDEKPYYTQNLAFAKALTEEINRIKPGACKKVLVKDGRYNQHIGVFSILVEVGHNRNTLSQALEAVGPLSAAIHQLLIVSPRTELSAMRTAYLKAINGT